MGFYLEPLLFCSWGLHEVTGFPLPPSSVSDLSEYISEDDTQPDSSDKALLDGYLNVVSGCSKSPSQEHVCPILISFNSNFSSYFLPFICPLFLYLCCPLLSGIWSVLVKEYRAGCGFGSSAIKSPEWLCWSRWHHVQNGIACSGW